MPNKILDAPEGIDFAGTEEVLFEAEPARPATPEMDPASPKWNPKKYFELQEKVAVIVRKTAADLLADPTQSTKQMIRVSINGYGFDVEKGKMIWLPRDFADHLVDIKAADYAGR